MSESEFWKAKLEPDDDPAIWRAKRPDDAFFPGDGKGGFVRVLPGLPYRDGKVTNPPPPVDRALTPEDMKARDGKSVYPDEIVQTKLGVPRASMRGFFIKR
jgi:hypothetical protein